MGVRTAESRNFIIGIAAVVLGLVYLYVATGGFSSPGWPNHHMNGKYHLLEQALLSGHTYVAESPLSDFLAWDLSFFKQKYYLYFGIVPALLLYLPVHLASAGRLELTDCLATLIFSLATFMVTARTLNRILSRYYPETSHTAFIGCLALLGLCNNSISLLDFSRAYEVAISGAVFFQQLALALLIKAWLEPLSPAGSPRYRLIALMSGCLALSIGCRPTFALGALVLLAITFWQFRACLKPPQGLAALLGPFLLGLLGLGIYNFIRFEAWTDFGIRYQSTVIPMGDVRFFGWDRVLPGLYFYLVQPPIMKAGFPFLTIQYTPVFTGVPSPYHVEMPFGLLVSTPFVLILPLGLRCALQNRSLRFAMISLALGLLSLASLAAYPTAAGRYNSDFHTHFTFATCLVWCFLLHHYRAVPIRLRRTQVLGWLAWAWSIYMNLWVARR